MRNKNKRRQQPPDVFQMYALAMQFTTANILLFQHKEEPNHPFMTAWMINELFIYELLLKCLACLESKPMPSGHDLAGIFYQLSPTLQQKITNAYEAHFAKDINLMTARLKSSEPESYSLRKQLKKITDSYIKLRYFFDRSSFMMEFNTVIGIAMEHAILEMRPNWKPWSSMIQDGPATHMPVSSNSNSILSTTVSPPRT